MSEQEIRVGQVWRRKKNGKLIRITRGDPWGWDEWSWLGYDYKARGATAGGYILRDYELVDDGTLIEYLTKLRDEYQADSFTAQAEHARWQERAEAAEQRAARMEAAIREILAGRPSAYVAHVLSSALEQTPEPRPVTDAPDSILVEGSWIPVKEWPKILGNFMRDNDALGREAKGYAAEIDRLTKERLHAELHREEERQEAAIAEANRKIDALEAAAKVTPEPLPLDPEPWLCTFRYCETPGFHRAQSLRDIGTEIAWAFKPREAYEQDPARYDKETERSM